MRVDARTPFFYARECVSKIADLAFGLPRHEFIVRTKFALVAISGLGLALRLVQLDAQPLWWDEGYSVFFATRALPTLLARTAIDIHPPLYYVLLRTWMLAFGPSAPALRLLSVVIGVAAIPLVFNIARALFNTRVGLVSASLVAIAPLHIYYSQELRMYGLVTLLALASIALQLKILNTARAQPSLQIGAAGLGATFAYILVTALALYTQYFAVFFIAAEIAVVLYLKYRARWKIKLRAWTIAWGAVGVVYLPWLLYAGPKLFVYVTNKVGIEQYARLDPISYLVQHFVAFSIGHVSDWMWLAWGAVGVCALALLGLAASRRWQSGQGNSQFVIYNSLAAIYLCVPLALGFLVNLVYPFHPLRYERLLLFALPFFLIYVACGVLAVWERERGVGIVTSGVFVVMCALSLYDFYTVARYPDEDYRPLIQEMERVAAENDLVYAFYPWQVGYLATYYRGAPLRIYEIDGDAWIKNPDAMNSGLQTLREENPRAWILAYQKQGRILEDRVTNEYINDYVVLDQNFGNTRLEYFAQGNATDFELEPVTITRALTLRIQYASFEPPAHPELALTRFAWNASDDQNAYSLRLVDAKGNKLAQQDAPIPEGATTLRRGLALPKNLRAGEYTLQLVVYRRADGSPFTLPDGSSSISLAKLVAAP